MKILALGNSFSQDCTAHLGRMTNAYVRNLYIGGCSLERHAKSLNERIADYELQKDGCMIGEARVAANDIIARERWDVITVQQASGDSGLYERYEPYLSSVLEHIRALCPTATLVWNQTWAYTKNSTHPHFSRYGNDQQTMYERILGASRRAAEENGLGMIEVGRAMQALRHAFPSDEDEFCRDGFHLSMDYGRYAAAYVWARYFALPVNDYIPDGADPERMDEIRTVINSLF